LTKEGRGRTSSSGFFCKEGKGLQKLNTPQFLYISEGLLAFEEIITETEKKKEGGVLRGGRAKKTHFKVMCIPPCRVRNKKRRKRKLKR